MPTADRIILGQADLDRLERIIETQGALRDRRLIEALRDELDSAEVVDRAPADAVAMGSRVRFADETNGQEDEITLVYPADADPAEHRISVLAPIGSALIGLRVGQAIDWPMPGGRTTRLRVVSVG